MLCPWSSHLSHCFTDRRAFTLDSKKKHRGRGERSRQRDGKLQCPTEEIAVKIGRPSRLGSGMSCFCLQNRVLRAGGSWGKLVVFCQANSFSRREYT